MVWRPTNAGPRNLRELYHWVHGQFVSVGEQVNGGGGVGDHPSLTDRDVADQHPTAAITNLDTEQATQDGRLTAIEAEQIVQNDDIDTRVIAGYGGIVLNTPTAITLDVNWTTLPADAPSYLAPVDVAQEFATNSLEFQSAGEWLINTYFSLNHNENNSGRVFYVRVFDFTSSLPVGVETEVFVGRNQPGTNFAISLPANILPADIGDRFQIQVGGTSDSFSSVFVRDFTYLANRISAGSTTGGSPTVGTLVESVAMDPTGSILFSGQAGWSGAYEADGRVRVTFPTAASSNVMQSIVGTANNAGVSPNGTYLFVTEITATDCLVNTQNAAGNFAPRAFSIHRTYG